MIQHHNQEVETRGKLIVLMALTISLAFLSPNLAQKNQSSESLQQKEAEQVLQGFKEVLESETEGIPPTESKEISEQAATARNRILKLGKIATPVLIKAIMMKNLSIDFRGMCIDMLICIQDERSIKPLSEIAGDKSETPGIRKEALLALGKIAGPDELHILIEALECKESIVKKGAISGIWGLAGRGIIEFPMDRVLSIAKSDSNSNLRAYAIASLRLGGEKVVPSLIELMNDQNERVRFQACQSLGLIGDNRAVEPLIAKIDDKGSYERMIVIEALGIMGDKTAVKPLINVLNERGPFDEPTTAALYAAKALAEIGDKTAVESLKRAIEDEIEWKHKSNLSPIADKWLTSSYKKLTGEEYPQ